MRKYQTYRELNGPRRDDRHIAYKFVCRLLGPQWITGQSLSRALAYRMTVMLCHVAFGFLPNGYTADEATAAPVELRDTCELCSGRLPVPVVPLSTEWLDSIASARARSNALQIERIDSLFQSGYLGPPAEPESQGRAHLLARLTLVNVYRDLVGLAGDSTCVYEANEKTLEEFVTRYSDVSLFATMRLERVRMGLGHVCLRYNVEEKTGGEVSHGGKRLRWRVKDSKIDGKKRRVLSVDLPTGDHEVVEVLIAPHYFFKVEYARIDGPPAPYEWFLVYDIEGAWIKKWGTHRPKAYMFWVTPQPVSGEPIRASLAAAEARNTRRMQLVMADYADSGDGTLTAAVPRATSQTATASISAEPYRANPGWDMPSTPLVGIRMYIPGLRLKLPLFLPDINFDDLREVELAMPILNMDYLRHRRQPSWLGADDDMTFADWKGYGAVPPAIRERFPDW